MWKLKRELKVMHDFHVDRPFEIKEEPDGQRPATRAAPKQESLQTAPYKSEIFLAGQQTLDALTSEMKRIKELTAEFNNAQEERFSLPSLSGAKPQRDNRSHRHPVRPSSSLPLLDNVSVPFDGLDAGLQWNSNIFSTQGHSHKPTTPMAQVADLIQIKQQLEQTTRWFDHKVTYLREAKTMNASALVHSRK
jgi:hypothetical protein